jgi:hypothetical protein
LSNPFDFGPPSPARPGDAKDEAADKHPPKNLFDEASRRLVDAASGVRIAQGILLFVGVISFALNLYLFLNMDKEIAEAQAAGARITSDKIKVVRAVYTGATALGAAFVALGLVVWKAPLAVTIVGFLSYLIGNVIFLSYTDFAGGAANYAKVFFTIALAKAMSDAAAYERAKMALRKAEKVRRTPEVR